MNNKLKIGRTIKWKSKPNRKYFLRHLIETNNFTTMCEVGVRDGRTTFYLLDKIPTLTIYGIDLDTTLFYNDEVNNKYKDRLIPIQGKSGIVVNEVPNVDLVFIGDELEGHGTVNDFSIQNDWNDYNDNFGSKYYFEDQLEFQGFYWTLTINPHSFPFVILVSTTSPSPTLLRSTRPLPPRPAAA